MSREVWFVTGSQHLYGPAVLDTVAANSLQMVDGLNASQALPLPLQFKTVVKSSSEIYSICQQANADDNCIGLVFWCHTFSPAKMWIGGLNALTKPFMQLHTQFNNDIPWAEIDMDYMNLHQSAHGDREFGHIITKMRIDRKVVAGHWQDARVHAEMSDWFRAANGVAEGRSLKVARFGDNMRDVAVTDGDKVSAQMKFGYEVHGYAMSDLAKVVDAVSAEDIEAQLALYQQDYVISDEFANSQHAMDMLRNEARLELGLRRFLDAGGFKAFTTCFENLDGLSCLPGLATQRLMAQGFGYGAEGDWKTSAMLRIMKVMSEGLDGGNSFMEDYTYNMGNPGQVLGAHMLEVCPTIAGDKPRVELFEFNIGVRSDVVRLLFNAKAGEALNVSPVDLGDRFRIVINEVKTIDAPHATPKLPVATALWEAKPNLAVASSAWIHAGAAHHSVYTQALTTDIMVDYAEMLGVEAVIIDADTTIRSFKNELRQSAAYYYLNGRV